jgi:epoxyqueuosine reductase
VRRVDLVERIRAEAERLGFARCAFSAAGPVARHGAYRRWVDAGLHGEMRFMAENREVRGDVRRLLPGARTVITVVASYHAAEPDGPATGPRGFVARYARGADYHGVLKRRLSELADFVRRECGADVASRTLVDTAPLLEREAAHRGGAGFIGKNTLVITPGVGSYTVLGELVVDLPLPPDPPARPRCGRCRMCIDACPTGAIGEDRTVDARRCISYLTIEHHGPIPRELRKNLGDMIFGCDLCQQVCPYNANVAETTLVELRPRPGRSRPPLLPLLALNPSQYKRFVRGTALRRVRRGQLLRNVCVALGNSGDRSAVPALCRALLDRDPLVRGHAAWALGQLGEGAASLRARRAKEPEAWVQDEIDAAIARGRRAPGSSAARARRETPASCRGPS